MGQPNGCSTHAPKSSAAKQWIKEELAQTKEANFCWQVSLSEERQIIWKVFFNIQPLTAK